MAAEKLTPIAWLFGAILVSGLLMAFAAKPLQGPLAVAHKILALACLVLLVRAAGLLWGLRVPPMLPAAIAAFAAAFLACFAAGIVESIPACAGALWLNLHRLAAVCAALACALAARLMVLAARPPSNGL